MARIGVATLTAAMYPFLTAYCGSMLATCAIAGSFTFAFTGFVNGNDVNRVQGIRYIDEGEHKGMFVLTL